MINIPVVWRRNIELWRAVMIFGCKSRVIVRWISLHQTSWKALRRVFIKGSRNLWGGFAVLSYSGWLSGQYGPTDCCRQSKALLIFVSNPMPSFSRIDEQLNSKWRVVFTKIFRKILPEVNF